MVSPDPDDVMSTPRPGLSAAFPSGPRTPEPSSFSAAHEELPRPPSPPRPRLRLKRRGVPHLSAPTQNFLASVAAADVSLPDVTLADVPIPSIEEPETPSTFNGLFRFPDHIQQSSLHHAPSGVEQDTNLLSVRGRSAFSPPKTPAPGALPSLSPSRYPNWTVDSVRSSSVESSPERECGSSSRPSTARSTLTSTSSIFSQFSQMSDDDQCISPEDDGDDKFSFNPGRPLRKDSSFTASDSDMASSSKRQPRKAPWTRAMSSHLWATYSLYLQDPKVTPFRVGKSCVPPHGVCLRVAREAKRSWKGSKAMARAVNGNAETTPVAESADPHTNTPTTTTATSLSVNNASAGSSDKSGSSTPTAGSGSGSGSGTFMEWPHTNAATRAHLRELCRIKAATPGVGARSLQHMSRSPTPFTQTDASARADRVTPGASSTSAFATQDMFLSLAVSTSDVMQPHGPLAQLTRSGSSELDMGFNMPLDPRPEPVPTTATTSTVTGSVIAVPSSSSTTAHELAGRLTSAIEAEEPSMAERRRLGSPFAARSYGPSSSSSLAAVLGLSTANPRQSHTMGPRRSLQSPVRISRSGTQKRRTKQLSLDIRRRPGMASDFFMDPSNSGETDSSIVTRDMVFRHTPRGVSLGGDELFIPRFDPISIPPVPPVPSMSAVPSLTASSSAPQLPTSAAPVDMEEPIQSEHLQPPPVPRAFGSLGSHGHRGGLANSALISAGGASSASGSGSVRPPARLGSPFSAKNTSFSFPNRFSHPADFDLGSTERPFATVQRVAADPKPIPARTNLASRLAYIDRRLKELNNRNDQRNGQNNGQRNENQESQRRRSESPF